MRIVNYLFLFLPSLLIIVGCDNDVNIIDSIDNGIDIHINPQETISDSEFSDYYWYHNKKIFLKKNITKQYILYKDNIQDWEQKNNAQFAMDNTHDLDMACIIPLKKTSIQKESLKWGIIENVQTQKINLYQNQNILYCSPVYETSGGKEIGISHLFYVKLKSEADEDKLIDFASKYKVEILGKDKYLPLWYTLSCDKNSSGDVLEIVRSFYESGVFSTAEPDIMVNLSMSSKASLSYPNDTYFNKQWNLNGLYSINCIQAHQLTKGKNTRIAIIDQGIEQLHPDFDFKFGLIGYDLVNFTADSRNVVYGSHGTACAGIIKATANNNKGIVGVAPEAELISFCHPLQKNPNAIQQLANGLEVAAMNYDVISCSWGDESLTSTMIEDALHYYAFWWGRNGKGTVVVFSTGNDHTNVSFPANCNSNILTVGSINTVGERSSFSNFGTELDVVAPGEKIATTDLLGQYGYSTSEYCFEFEGTSAACPHVAAIASLILSANPDLKGSEVNDIIEKTARKIGDYNYSTVPGRPNGTWNEEMGYGLVDAYAAVQEAIKRKNNKQ